MAIWQTWCITGDTDDETSEHPLLRVWWDLVSAFYEAFGATLYLIFCGIYLWNTAV